MATNLAKVYLKYAPPPLLQAAADAFDEAPEPLPKPKAPESKNFNVSNAGSKWDPTCDPGLAYGTRFDIK